MKELSNHSVFTAEKNPEKEVLKKFFARRERMTGNDADESLTNQAAEFLLGLLNKDTITVYHDLDYKKCRWFI